MGATRSGLGRFFQDEFVSDTQDETEVVIGKLKALRAAQLEQVWPAAKAAAASRDHAPLVDLIKVYTAIQALDFALAHRPDPNAVTRVKPGF